MPAELIFVHGIGGSRDPVAECRQWTKALAEGARRAGHSALAARLPDWPIRFAAYHDLYDDAGSDLPPGTDAIVADLLAEVIDSHPPSGTHEGTRWALTKAREQLGQDSPNRLADVAATIMGIKSLRAAGQWADGRRMLADLAQIARYLSRSALLDEQIRARVQESIGTGPVVLVGHSLGTIVALETLHEYAASVPLFVTLGSPLGMRRVVGPRLFPQPPSTPVGVRRWLNFWDRDDLIVPRRKLDLRPNADGVVPVSERIDSDGVWVHTATKYLAQPGVAGPIAEALAA
jgi:pimeloyl-ACP methyl ester carboxylesterase